MPGFDDQSVRRITRTVREHERRRRNERGHRGRHNNKRQRPVYFELLAALTQWSGDFVLAARRTLDMSQNSGRGALVTDCDDTLLVADLNDVGHTAGVGGLGKGWQYRASTGELIVIIDDLCCPGDEQGECGGSGS